MKLQDVTRWNVRVSMAYAIGIWTMLGTYGFLHLKKKREQAIIGSSAEDSAETTYQEELQTTVEPQKETKKEFLETHVVVKDGFVPFSSRIYNYGKSVFGVSSDISTEKWNSKK